jgi:hypothetical protein
MQGWYSSSAHVLYNEWLQLATTSLFVWLVADGWCWFVLREKYCWLVAGGWFVVREKYCWLVAGGWFVVREKYCWLVTVSLLSFR